MRRLSVTTKDLRRLLDVTDPAQGDEPGGPLPWSLLSGLMDLVGCDAVTYESHDIGNSAVRHHRRRRATRLVTPSKLRRYEVPSGTCTGVGCVTIGHARATTRPCVACSPSPTGPTGAQHRTE